MTKLMDKQDWMRVVANASTSEGVWSENIFADSGTIAVAVPESGAYQVILVKMGNEVPFADSLPTTGQELKDGNAQTISQRTKMFGALKGKIKSVAPDFDEPLEDFAEYM